MEIPADIRQISSGGSRTPFLLTDDSGWPGGLPDPILSLVPFASTQGSVNGSDHAQVPMPQVPMPLAPMPPGSMALAPMPPGSMAQV